MNWIITIPKKVKWLTWEAELEHAKLTKEVMNFRLPHFVNARTGERCYVVYDGFIRGWMPIAGVWKTFGFKCSTTGTEWPPGVYLQRYPEFSKINPIPMKGFQGIRRFSGHVETRTNESI